MQAAATLVNGSTEPPAVTLGMATLPAGTESVVEITGANFVEGQTTIGFGTPDIDVRRIWFPSPNRMLANIWVAPGAAGRQYHFSVLNGLRLTTQTGALQVTSTRSGWLTVPATPVGGLIAGQNATVVVNGITLTGLSPIQLLVNDRPAQVVGIENNVVTFTVPNGLTPGVAVIRLQSGAETALPLATQVVQQVATVSSVTAGFGVSITPERPARYGELMSLIVSGLPENFAPVGTEPRVTLTIGGVEHRLLTVAPSGGFLQLQFTVQTIVPQGNQPLVVTLDGATVAPYTLPVRAF